MKYTKHAVLLFLGTLVYAIARYNVFGDIPWVNVPLYVCNKALSWTGLLLFGFSILSKEKSDRQGYGALAAATIGIHVVISAMILDPAYYTKFFVASGRMNLVGEASMMAGVAASTFLAGLFVAHVQGKESGKSLRSGWGRAVLWLSGLHVLIMGFAGWLTPGKWPGYMPPITMISFLIVVYFLYGRARRAG